MDFDDASKGETCRGETCRGLRAGCHKATMFSRRWTGWSSRFSESLSGLSSPR